MDKVLERLEGRSDQMDRSDSFRQVYLKGAGVLVGALIVQPLIYRQYVVRNRKFAKSKHLRFAHSYQSLFGFY